MSHAGTDRTPSLASFVCAAALAGCGGTQVSPAEPQPTATEFANPNPVTIAGYTGDAMEPFVSPDGQVLFFNDANTGANTNLFYATRVDDLTFRFAGEVPGANGGALDAVPSLDTDGQFFFISTRSYDRDRSTIFHGEWSSAGLTNVRGVTDLPAAAPGFVIFDACIGPAGDELYFAEGDFRSGSLASARLVVAEKTATGFRRSPQSDALLAAVNAAGPTQYAPALTSSGLELFFTRVERGSPVIATATRPNAHEPFGTPRDVAALTGFVEAPALSLDAHAMYFHQRIGDRFVVLRATRP